MVPLALEAVEKRYGETPALAGLSLRFASNEITAIIGRSGCGKSTLLKLCNGLEQPDRGQVEVFGEALDYRNLPALRCRLGYAVQGTGLFPHLSARRNITLLAELQRWSSTSIDTRLDELLWLCQLEAGLLEKYPHQLSGGQQQRVGLCRAMMLRPEILLLDEPFAAIDPITRLDIHEQLLAMHAQEPTTIVLITHDMDEAMRLADRVVIMEAGRIVQTAEREALMAQATTSSPDRVLRSLLLRAGE